MALYSLHTFETLHKTPVWKIVSQFYLLFQSYRRVSQGIEKLNYVNDSLIPKTGILIPGINTFKKKNESFYRKWSWANRLTSFSFSFLLCEIKVLK